MLQKKSEIHLSFIYNQSRYLNSSPLLYSLFEAIVPGLFPSQVAVRQLHRRFYLLNINCQLTIWTQFRRELPSPLIQAQIYSYLHYNTSKLGSFELSVCLISASMSAILLVELV